MGIGNINLQAVMKTKRMMYPENVSRKPFDEVRKESRVVHNDSQYYVTQSNIIFVIKQIWFDSYIQYYEEGMDFSKS